MVATVLSIEIIFASVGVVITVLGFCGGIFQYAVIRPIENKLSDLTNINKSILNALNRQNDRIHAIELKITEIEQRARSNQHRIEALEASAHERP